MKRSILLSSVAAVAVLGMAGPASADVVLNADGTGSVAKGDVQSALGWNDAAFQAGAGSVTFQTAAPATQSSTQSVSQSATETLTQTLTQTISCTWTTTTGGGNGGGNGVGNGGKKDNDNSEPVTTTETRTATRTATVTTTREGERTGTRTGTETGTLFTSIGRTLESNKQGKFLRYVLTGFGAQTFTGNGDTVWQEPELGEYTFGAPTGSTEPVYSDWQGNGGSCESSEANGKASDIRYSTATEDGPGALVERDVVYGDLVTSTPTATGAAVFQILG